MSARSEDSKYRRFVEEASQLLPAYLTGELEGASVSTQTVNKVQGEGYFGLTIRPKDQAVGATFNMEPFYESFLLGDPLESLLKIVAENAVESLKKAPDAEGFMDLQAAKKLLLPQLIPVSGNEQMLRDIPHRIVEDLAIIYRLVRKNGGDIMMLLVNNAMLENYDVSEEKLNAEAFASAMVHYPVRITELGEMIEELADVKGLKSADGNTFVVTNESMIYGASCLFYPGFLKETSKDLGSFFILPSSIHEVLFMKDTGNEKWEDLEKIVYEVNHNEVKPSERLTDTVYHYDAEDDVFETAAKWKTRKNMV